MWNSHAMKYHSAEKEQTTDTCNNMVEPRKPYVKGQKPDTPQKTYCDSMYMKFLEKTELYRKKADQWLLG